MPDFPFDAVLFDMDGVILDSMGHHASSWERILAAEGLEVERQFILEHEGCLGIEVLLKLLEEQGRAHTEEEAMALMKRLLSGQFELYLGEYIHNCSPYPGAAPLLAALARAGVPTALVTSSRRPLVERSLGGELLGRFSCVISADDVTRYKPDPEPYQTAARHLGSPAERCLVVENAPAGIAAAKAAGACCYAVASTLPMERLHRAEADLVFRTLEELAVHLGLARN